MTEVPNFVPSEFEEEHEKLKRQKVLRVVNEERENARKLWPDCYPEAMPEFVTDAHLEAWYKEDLVVRYLPKKELAPAQISSLPYRFDSYAIKQLEDIKSDAYNPFAIDGGWYVVASEPYTRKEFTESWILSDWPTTPWAGELIYSMPRLTKDKGNAQSMPRLPAAVELLYFTNVEDDPESDVPEELCRDLVPEKGPPKFLSVRFARHQAELSQLRTIDRFEGGVRPMWRLH